MLGLVVLPQVLSLNATFIGEGSRELAGAFRRGACKQLQELYLRNVYLKDSGVHDLITALLSGEVGGTLQVPTRTIHALH